MNKKLLSLMLLIPAYVSASAVQIDPSLWEGHDSILNGIRDVANTMNSDLNVFSSMKSQLSSKIGVFSERDTQRKNTYACIRERINGLVLDVDNCLVNKQNIANQGELDKKDLSGQITQLMTSTTIEINALNEAIAALDAEIANLKTSIATLSDFSEDKINEIISELEVVRNRYAAMAVERAGALASLESLLVRTQAHLVSENNETQAIKDEICLDNDDNSNS